MSSATVNNPATGEQLAAGSCDFGGCGRPATFVVAGWLDQPDPAVVERRPLCTDHAIDHASSWTRADGVCDLFDLRAGGRWVLTATGNNRAAIGRVR